jgi:hypothetical protein
MAEQFDASANDTAQPRLTEEQEQEIDHVFGGGWNYRVVRTQGADGHQFSICEVFYNQAGEPSAWTEADPPSDTTVEGIRQELTAMLQACDRPILQVTEGKLCRVEKGRTGSDAAGDP